MLAIFSREVKSFFITMTGWVFVAFMLVFIGIYMMIYNLNYGYGNFEYVLSGLTFVYLMAVPLLTMRCFADERRQHTDQLLYALPLSSGKIVMGKYLAMLVVLAVLTVVSCTYPIIISLFGDVYLPTAYASILAFFLLGAALTAVGMFCSSLCESQVTAAVVCFIVLLVDYFISGLSSLVPSGVGPACFVVSVLIALGVVALIVLTKNGVFAVAVGVVAEVALLAVAAFNGSVLEGAVPDVLSGISLFERFSPFVEGVFDLASIAFFLAVTAAFAVLTVHCFEKRRWS